MKKTITLLSLVISSLTFKAQTALADFENFNLPPDSAYSPTTSTPFQAANASFQYVWDSSWALWTDGFSYTNIHDSINGGYMHPYGVRAYKGYNNSNTHVVGQDGGVITLSIPSSTVNGFYITNTTYAYKSMASGDMFAKKFGDTTGTGSGTTIPQGSYPDFFKVVIKGYKNGQVKNDSVVVLLADYTFTNNTQDYILNTWKYVDTKAIGAIDSIQFLMRSSDVGVYGINTPLYFAIDNFETEVPNPVGISKNVGTKDLIVFPNPFHSKINIKMQNPSGTVRVMDLSGSLVYEATSNEENTSIDLSYLCKGIYFLEIKDGDQFLVKKIIKD